MAQLYFRVATGFKKIASRFSYLKYITSIYCNLYNMLIVFLCNFVDFGQKYVIIGLLVRFNQFGHERCDCPVTCTGIYTHRPDYTGLLLWMILTGQPLGNQCIVSLVL